MRPALLVDVSKRLKELLEEVASQHFAELPRVCDYIEKVTVGSVLQHEVGDHARRRVRRFVIVFALRHDLQDVWVVAEISHGFNLRLDNALVHIVVYYFDCELFSAIMTRLLPLFHLAV